MKITHYQSHSEAWTDHHVYVSIFSTTHRLNSVEVNCMLWLRVNLEFTSTIWFVTFKCQSILVIIINGQSQILKQVKLWDLSNNQPSCIASTNPKAVSDYYNFSDINILF